jgi:phosphoglycolate phosphatase
VVFYTNYTNKGKNRMKYRMVFFDLDGTLVDSLLDISDAVNHMLEHNHLPGLSTEEVRKYIGKGAITLVEDILEGKSTNIEESVKVFLSYYRENSIKRSELYEGVRETIKEIDAKKFIFTNKTLEMARRTVEKCGLLGLFEEIIAPETYGTKKPDPAPILTLSEKYGINLNDTAFVGDSIVDIECARNAGIYCIIVSYGYGEKEDLEKADAVVHNFRDIMKYL